MKTIVKIIFLFGIITLTAFSCNKNPQIPEPGIAIYKTRGDYFNLVDIGMKGDNIFRIPSFRADKYKLIFTDSDTIYKYRYRLINGYILDAEADENYDVFLSLLFKRYLLMEENYIVYSLPEDTLRKYILDKDPYIEFYRETYYPHRFSLENLANDTTGINAIIRNNELEKYFEKIK